MSIIQERKIIILKMGLLLDLKSGFEEYINKGGVPYHPVDGHFNQNGTYIASNCVVEYLREKRWIE